MKMGHKSEEKIGMKMIVFCFVVKLWKSNCHVSLRVQDSGLDIDHGSRLLCAMNRSGHPFLLQPNGAVAQYRFFCFATLQ